MKCPHCNHNIDRHSPIDNKSTPNKKDYSVCINCGNYLGFNKDLTLRKLNGKDLEIINKDAELYELLLNIKITINLQKMWENDKRKA